ncbi:MAG: hypothetical protein LHW48_03760, partial [Candidatus Cloacimonetes bacterium]|nr:hypothetical protein [Candidatus Cloacimonadota bacterium]
MSRTEGISTVLSNGCHDLTFQVSLNNSLGMYAKWDRRGLYGTRMGERVYEKTRYVKDPKDINEAKE